MAVCSKCLFCIWNDRLIAAWPLSSFQLDRQQVLWFGEVRVQILVILRTSYVHNFAEGWGDVLWAGDL